MPLFALKRVVHLVFLASCLGCFPQPESIDRAIEDTAVGDQEKRVRAVLALGEVCKRVTNVKSRNRGIAILEEKLGDEAPRVRSASAMALGDLGVSAEGTLESLVKKLDDRDDDVRINAAAAIFLIAEPKAGQQIRDSKKIADALLAKLSDTVPTVRAHAIRGCVALAPKDENVIKAVADMTNDREDGVRIQAVQALESAGPAAMPYIGRIRALLTDKDNTVRWQAAVTLKRLEAQNKSNSP